MANPVEFVRRLANGRVQRAGNRVVIEDANGNAMEPGLTDDELRAAAVDTNVEQGPQQIVTSTFAAGNPEGSAFRVQGLAIMMCRMSADWTAASLGFRWAPDQEDPPQIMDYSPVYDTAGDILAFTVAGGRSLPILTTTIIGNGWVVPFSHDGAGGNVPQVAERVLTFALG